MIKPTAADRHTSSSSSHRLQLRRATRVSFRVGQFVCGAPFSRNALSDINSSDTRIPGITFRGSFSRGGKTGAKVAGSSRLGNEPPSRPKKDRTSSMQIRPVRYVFRNCAAAAFSRSTRYQRIRSACDKESCGRYARYLRPRFCYR